MSSVAKRMGRPPGEPTKIVRLPLPVAALAKRLADRTLRAGDINAILDIEPRRPASVPLVGANAACGFPSRAEDYLDRPLDIATQVGDEGPRRHLTGRLRLLPS